MVVFVFSLLASGSDDQHAVIWVPFKHKKLTTMHTGHAANIFSVKVSRTQCRMTVLNGGGESGLKSFYSGFIHMHIDNLLVLM